MQVKLAITSELDRVLGSTINELNPNVDAIYLVGTFLHKTVRFALTARDKSLASRWLVIKNAEWYTEVQKGQDGDSAGEPQRRTSGRDDKLDFFIIAESETVASKSPVELKIQSYMEIPMCSTDQIDSNPEKFWISASGKFSSFESPRTRPTGDSSCIECAGVHFRQSHPINHRESEQTGWTPFGKKSALSA
ncbi:hypothetical protein RvY_11918 [Ramazzottius varieornatus]|uniref:Uncharacterized protein n=1 Tax=Ramazzottius varieornatus TaxID=947166 RepID=A0A1D1VK41_RAMVA|nr:hypothetical protein RvY_11918 [Ramazzottius varieornatus]